VKTKSVSYFPSMICRSLEVLSERIPQSDEAQLCSLLQASRSVFMSLKDLPMIEQENKSIAIALSSEIRSVAEVVVDRVASRCAQIVSLAKPSTLRQLLADLIHIALPAHELVSAVEREVKSRLEIADKLENATSYEAIFNLTMKFESETKSNSAAPWNIFKAILSSFFSSDADAELNSSIDSIDIETARQLFMKAESLRRLHGSTGLTHSFDSIFELGRCLELVQEYKLLSQLWDGPIASVT
jgi:hypothetical protein